MKIGLQIPNFTWPGGDAALASTLKDIVQTADAVGFHSIWVMDHFFQLEFLGKPDQPMLESYSALTYIAALTEKVKLGTMITGVIYRQPGFLVKQVTNLDVLSNGRAYFGVGAAWFEREARGLGFPFPPVATRFEWLEETLQIAQQMWSGEVKPYEGKHFQLAETICNPQPLSKPHPPIMIGGMGEKKTLRLVAQYADACNLFARVGTAELKRKLNILQEHCVAVGRPYSEIEKTCLGSVNLSADDTTPETVIQQCRELADIGIEHAIFNMPMDAHTITPLELFGKEVIPAVAEFN